jgi:hypothetical protein
MSALAISSSITNRGTRILGNTFVNCPSVNEATSCCIKIITSSGFPILIQGNYFEYIRRVLDSQVAVHFDSNIIRKCHTTSALYLFGPNARVTNNIFEDVNARLMYVQGAGAVIEDNVMRNVDGSVSPTTGVVYLDGADNSKVRRNHVHYAALVGGVPYRADSDVANLVFTGNTWENTNYFKPAVLDGVCTEADREVATADTTDVTTETLDQFYTNSDRLYFVEAWVVATETDDYDEMASWKLAATFRNDGGTLTLVGQTEIHAQKDTGAWDADLDADATLIRLRITGANITNINWKGQMSWREVE